MDKQYSINWIKNIVGYQHDKQHIGPIHGILDNYMTHYFH